MSFGWEGRKIRLVPLERATHLDNAVRWLNDPEITGSTLVGDLPIARLAEEAYFEGMERADALGAPTDITFAIETLEGEHVGFSGLHRIDYRHGAAVSGTLIGRRELWGRGLGSDAVRVRTRYAFDVLGLRMLLAEVLADNAASLHMLAAVGYHEVGRVPERYFKRGAFRDAVLLALSARDWRPGE